MNEDSDGAARRRRAQGAKSDQLQAALYEVDPGMAEWANEFIFGQVWAREGISQDERMLVAIIALAATEHPHQLRNYLHGALDAGISARKIHEALVMLVVYVGFPTAIVSLSTWRDVVESARRRGVVLDLDAED